MSKKIIATENAPAAIGPYSQAVQYGDTIYVSGQIPLHPETKKMDDDVKAQTRQSMENIKAILKEAGSSMEKIIRCGIFVTDLGDFATVNEVYASFFTGDYPARATVQVAALPLGAKVEIDAIAAA
ncbi:endoribonuclease L-PSP [Desulfocapsa sulfexigens DSM 10523]|uniref:Endoribonuclease L-PSP n=1 Tax=Desulfocapsa sulfexigens (strain DSM 10523 / SB164P1) TaxID=1167006 RepID=M1PN45_DESSD|nr:RidA family protein [Desulfocapsa sulfexigens]AGF77866.1 endoribonuclease L-PSP [Desulfocapsa sulfexigens DSM 10523]